MSQTRFHDVRRFESIDSTNRYLLDEARAGAAEGVVAVADHQTAGRGRLGRSWEAPAGANLLFSVLLRPTMEPAERHLATTAVALAAIDAIVALAAALDGSSTDAGQRGAAGRIGIKWPNDLVGPDGRKLAGILAEADLTSGSAASPAPIVVGIGVNVNWPAVDEDLPAELRGTAVSLRQLVGRPVDREALLSELLAALEPRVTALSTAQGRARLAEDFRSVCTTVGTRVRVELPDGAFEGTATAVTSEGHLSVDTGQGIRTVVAGDVIHVRPGS
ncbi:MAG: biotin--[acetyl-CoA-carboxylase] ligase [Acidimicrobiales bacterium]|jgi:BirA family biotin operon repressor/biotin-[acetyl-CoA-carboxylase] ligase